MKDRERVLKRKLLRGAGQAIADFGMIREGDRVMTCLSGGKDGYVLLDLLLDLQRRAPVRFELLAVNLDQHLPGFPGEVIPRYLAALGVPFRVVRKDTWSIVKRTLDETETVCALCSRLRRGILYNTAVEEGCTRIALGHHADDLVQTFFLNLFFEGTTRSLPPLWRTGDGRNTVIRPLAYCWESDVAAYAALRDYPIIPNNLCGITKPLERRRMRDLLDGLEREIPNVRHSILAALAKDRFGVPPEEPLDP